MRPAARRLSPLLAPALIVLVGAASLAACATAPAEASSLPPDYSLVATTPAPDNARLYANCLGQAAEAGAYARAHDDSTELILFTCTGIPARAFYDGLAARSAAVGSQFVSEGRTYRATNAVVRNLFGVDHCSTDSAEDYRCVVSFNAGAFLTY
jgi:hypothetical protein